MACDRRYRRWIDAALVHGIRPRKWRRLRTHLDGCAACRHRLERIIHVSRALTPKHPIGALELDLIGREVLEVAAVHRTPKRAIVTAAALALGAASLALVLSRRTDEFQTRGQTPTFARPPGARVFCVHRLETGAANVMADARATGSALPAPRLRCTLSDRLQLTYSTPNLAGLTMVAFASKTGDVFWYAPRRASEPAIALAPDVVERALDWSTRLDVNHTPGLYDLRVLFFRGPVVAEDAVTGRAIPMQTVALQLEVLP